MACLAAFRLANTSWRGLRFAFTGSVGGAYRALLPVLMIPLAFAAAPAFIGDGIGSALFAMAGGLIALASLPLTPYLGRPASNAISTGMTDTPVRRRAGRRVLRPWLRSSAVSVLPVLLLIGGMVLVMPPLGGATRPAPSAAIVAGMVLAVLVCHLLLFILIQPFFTARLLNLVWGGTRSLRLSFASRLRFRDLALLTLAYLLLMIVTLGLYQPFAAVRTARLRLEAVSITTSGNIDEWAGGAASAMRDASGDAGGDLLGIDLGL